jgi:hypothetical protein
MAPMFWCQSAQGWVTIPGVDAADVYVDWLLQAS